MIHIGYSLQKKAASVFVYLLLTDIKRKKKKKITVMKSYNLNIDSKVNISIRTI